MDRQEQIDKIAQWMGWHKRESRHYGIPVNEWHNVSEKKVAKIDFDPFTNPSDCSRVMGEVVKRGYDYDVTCCSDGCEVTIERGECRPMPVPHSHGETESEAKMNALLEAIEGERG